MHLSAIIPLRGTADKLMRLLQSLTESDAPTADIQIIIVNDGAPTINEDDLHERFPELRLTVLYNHKTIGSYASRNRGAAHAEADRLVFWDADIRLAADWYSRLRPVLFDCDYIAVPVSVIKKRKESLGEKFSRLQETQVAEYTRRYRFGLTRFIVVGQSVFQAVGGFDERLYSGGDMLFGNDVYQAGYSQFFYSQALAEHEPTPFGGQFRRQLRIQKGRDDIARRYPERFPQMAVTPVGLWQDVKSLAGALLYVRQHPIYIAGELSYPAFAYVMLRHHWVVIVAKLLILMFPNRRFNL